MAVGGRCPEEGLAGGVEAGSVDVDVGVEDVGELDVLLVDGVGSARVAAAAAGNGEDESAIESIAEEAAVEDREEEEEEEV